MSCRTRMAVALTLVLAFPALLPARKVKVDFNRAADFSAYKTYAWTEGVPAKGPGWNALIIAAIEDELNHKGLRKVETSQADLLVAYYAAVDTDINPGGLSDPLNQQAGGYTGLAEGWGPSADLTARIIRKGSLAVRLVDRRQGALVWMGSASGTLKETNQKRLEQINKAASLLFEHYPPKTK